MHLLSNYRKVCFILTFLLIFQIRTSETFQANYLSSLTKERNHLPTSQKIQSNKPFQGSFITKGSRGNEVYYGYSPKLGTVHFEKSSKIRFFLHQEENRNKQSQVDLEFWNSRETDPVPFNQQLSTTTYIFLDEKTRSQNYQSLKYNNLWKGIDLIFHSTDSTFKSEFYLDGSNIHKQVSKIKFRYSSNTTHLVPVVNEKGQLILQDEHGSVILVESSPIVYQDNRQIDCQFVLDHENYIQIQIDPNQINENTPLIIDPTYSTYIGYDNGSSSGIDLIVLDDQSVIFIGLAVLTKFPVTSQYGKCELNSIIVVKMSSDGSEILWSTIIGSESNDLPCAIKTDQDNNIVVSGLTDDTITFPVIKGSYFDDCRGIHQLGSVVFRLSPTGDELIHSTIICASTGPRIEMFSHNFDQDNNLYLLMINYGIFETCKLDEKSLLIIKMSSDFKTLINSSCYNPVQHLTSSNKLLLDSQGNLILVGYSENVIESKKHKSNNNDKKSFNKELDLYDNYSNNIDNNEPPKNCSCFVLKVDPNNLTIIWEKFIGGENQDNCVDYDIDSLDNIWIVGFTRSKLFPITSNGWVKTAGFELSGFLLNLASNGSELLYSTYIHSTTSTGAWNTAESIKIAKNDQLIYVCGRNSLEQLWWFLGQIYSSDEYWDYCLVFDKSNLEQPNTTISIKFEQDIKFSIVDGIIKITKTDNYALGNDDDDDQNKIIEVPTIYIIGSSQDIITTKNVYKEKTKVDNAFITHLEGCGEGYYGNNSFDCIGCPSGTSNSEVDQKQCKPCKEGYCSSKSFFSKIRTCVKCDIGSYNNLTGQGWCKKCLPGTFSNQPGFVNCLPCAKGYYSENSGSSVCSKCKTGQYNEKTGQKNCKICSSGYVSETEGSVSCKKCNFFTKTNKDQSKCEINTTHIYIIVFPIFGLIVIISLVTIWYISRKRKRKKLYIRITSVQDDSPQNYEKGLGIRGSFKSNKQYTDNQYNKSSDFENDFSSNDDSISEN
ncbi:cell surface glycoprotein (s-layer protein)-like protein [Anaeramoeba flamelloides]|uniref:Cell surface glycoprotein (S-layer protein)-like protein n=1 Tax=Anaeramoeba flamelloides TaxID=1746091 RepID=A0AAV7Y3C1_9EUKA|nr:cell surface glycoprotein (s-layer protein)-like protein [Anaeramoeba flamelloides]